MNKRMILSFAALVAVSMTLNAGNINQLLHKGKYEAAKNKISSDSSLLKFSNEHGVTPCHIAAQKGELELLSFMVEKGADVNATDKWGKTPLFNAIYGQHADVAKLLIKSGANVNVQNQWKQTPLHAAAFRGNPLIFKSLMHAGSDLNAINGDGSTVLHSLVSNGHQKLAKAFIGKAKNLNQKNTDQETLIALAAKNGMVGLVALLIEKEVDLDVADKRYGRKALHYAAINGYDKVARMLVEAGSSLNVADKSGQTAESYLARYSAAEAGGALTQIAKANQSDQVDVVYTGHSGWVVKTANQVLVFDYWKPKIQPDHPSLANGWLTKADAAGLPVTVFTSHKHGDHYDVKALKSLHKTSPKVAYVYGFNPKQGKTKDKKVAACSTAKAEKTKSCEKPTKAAKAKQPGMFALKPRTTKQIGDMTVTTIASVDSGVGFLVEVDGVRIFHAGDHANLTKEEADIYYSEIKFLKAEYGEVDIAFLPVSGCPSRWKPEAVEEGFFKTSEILQVKMALPMHGGGREWVYQNFAEKAEKWNCKAKVLCAENPGDYFRYGVDQQQVAMK